ncbi:fungal-specific transcription factor domain protein [Xylaria sp. CBS 124048]|nr:fungal-specific transcription factor domain protein [Xylaria sp. CBS 124048]
MEAEMETETVDSRDESSLPLSRRACDQCRLRKIRCDKETPCSNCRSARRSCSCTGAGQRPKEQRQRVLISSQYERKIDKIEDRLAGIETLLQQLLSTQSTPSSDPAAPQGIIQNGYNHGVGVLRQSVTSPNTASPVSSNRIERGGLTPEKGGDGEGSSAIFAPEEAETFEGNSSLAAHTAFASQFLADAVRKTTLGDSTTINPKFNAALNSLREIVNMQNRSRQRTTAGVWSPAPPLTNPVLENSESTNGEMRNRKQPQRWNLKDLPLPPMELVLEQLSEMRHGPVPVMLAIIYTFIDYEHFIDRCRQLYFNTDSISEASFVTVNTGLAYIFFEASLTSSDPAKTVRYEESRVMARNNLEIALSQLNLMMPATAENIEALLMGASYCIDESRASFAWILVSRAAHMCRTLGYHQAHTMKDDEPQTKADKSLLFWCTYMLDKALSLRLGRASILQDYDISLPHVTPNARAAYPGKEVMTLWIQHARVLGRIYEHLYSPGALRKSEALRTEQVGLLASEQRRLMAETVALLREFESATEGEARMFAITLKADQVSFLASLALTYRALPPNGPRSRTFSDECIEAARASMRCHQEAIDMMSDRSLRIVYIHWTILYAPFIPFIVIFCLVIETSDQDDRRRLADFVKSLEPACEISSSVRKLYQLCQVLLNVAELYVEAKAVEPVGLAGNEFDMYLSQLGFMPFGETAAGEIMSAPAGLNEMGEGMDHSMRPMTQTTQLEDWFSGKNYMMGLLEEDLSAINPTGMDILRPGMLEGR